MIKQLTIIGALAVVGCMCWLSGGCEAKVHIDSKPSQTATLRVLSTNELSAYFQMEEWERTNTVQYQVNSFAINEKEYARLTNWMRWMDKHR